MSVTERPKRFEPSGAAQDAERPRIWIDGRQRPRFDLRAFGAVSLGMAKRNLPPEMVEAEARLDGFGRRVQAGEIRVSLDWAARVLPSHQRVGGWLLGLARLFADTRALLVGVKDDTAELAYPDLIRGSAPVCVVGSRPITLVPPAAEEPTLHAIRCAIGPLAQDNGLEQAEGQAGEIDQASGAGPLSRGRQLLWRAACHGLLGILIAFALPAGAIGALIYHLDGSDLSDWS